MSGTWKVFVHDLKSAAKNPLSLVIILGLAVMPAFYSWLNIAGSWDPYGNTKNLKVAVATSDEGYTSELLPMQINLGERVVDELVSSSSIGYVYVSEDEAKAGVERGDYYAAIVLPKGFSKQMLGVISGNPTKADIYYYDNQKRNAIAQIVTDKASSAVKREIEESFTSSLSTVGASILSDVGNFMTDAQITTFANNLASRLDQLQRDMSQGTDTVSSYSDLVRTSANLLTTTDSSLSSQLQNLSNTSTGLSSAVSPIANLNSTLDSQATSIQGTLSSQANTLADVRKAIESAISSGQNQADDVASGLTQAKDLLQARIDKLSATKSSLQELIDAASAAKDSATSSAEKDIVDGALSALNNIYAQLDAAETEATSLKDTLNSSIQDIQNAKSDVAGIQDDVLSKLSAAEDALNSADTSYKNGLGATLSKLSTGLSDASNSANSIISKLDATSSSVSSVVQASAQDMQNFADKLDVTKQKLGDTNQKISDLRDKLTAAINSGDVTQIKTVLSAGVTPLANFLASPVNISKESIYPVANNGSAMTPYYSTMSIWVDGTLMGCVMIAKLSQKSREELQVNATQAYIGRLLFFMFINAIQALIVCAGDLFYLGVQSVHPLLFMATGLLASVVFINIIYALAVSFGDVGKAIAVFIMVIQVAGSGGTFPPEMLPSFFQKLYPYLPFVHAEALFRASIAGIYGNEVVMQALMLASCLIPALLLGLVLRHPLVSFNEYIERRLEDTHLM